MADVSIMRAIQDYSGLFWSRSTNADLRSAASCALASKEFKHDTGATLGGEIVSNLVSNLDKVRALWGCRFQPASSLFSYEAKQNRMQDPRIPKKSVNA